MADETKYVSIFRTVTVKELTSQVSDVRIDAGPRDYAPFVECLPIGSSRNKRNIRVILTNLFALSVQPKPALELA